MKDSSGQSLRKQLEQVENSIGTRDPRLDSVVIPRGVEYLWDRFWMMCNGQAPGIAEIKAFADLTHWNMTAFEFETMLAMSREFAIVIGERSSERLKE
jgi:hypothetical protein